METTQVERIPGCVIHCGPRCRLLRAGVLIVLLFVTELFPSQTYWLGMALVNAEEGVTSGLAPLQNSVTTARASSSAVGTIMALLAMLEEAGVLPPEGTPQANQVIHSVIQIQSAVMKSTSSEFAAYQVAVDRWWQSQHSEGVAGEAKANGLTARVLGAFIAYDQVNSLWDDPSLVLALQAFNVTRADWAIVVDLFQRAETVFRRQGRSLYEVYQGWHMKMPGEPS